MVKIAQADMFAFNTLNNSVVNAQAELQRLIQGRQAFIGMLENKYNAIFNPATGVLEPKPEKEPAKKEKASE